MRKNYGDKIEDNKWKKRGSRKEEGEKRKRKGTNEGIREYKVI